MRPVRRRRGVVQGNTTHRWARRDGAAMPRGVMAELCSSLDRWKWCRCNSVGGTGWRQRWEEEEGERGK